MRNLLCRPACARLAVSAERSAAALAVSATRYQVVRHVIVPCALPEILVGLRIGMGVGWTTLVAAEMVAASSGLRQMVLNASKFLRADVVILGVGAYGFEPIMRRLEAWLAPWKGKV